ncbi:MAG TPA: FKBP-type peptidyl-prolyl cis-trans isomerase [Gemmatimonadaceae bacterium]
MMKRLLMLAAVLSLAACSLEVSDPYANTTPSDPATETFEPTLKIDISKMTKTEAGTYYKDVTVGTGATLSGAEVVVVSYKGVLKDGSQFTLVGDQTVPVANLVGGLRDAMPGMKVGGERIIVVPSALGFGPVPRNGIPANSTLIFDVILKQIP